MINKLEISNLDSKARYISLISMNQSMNRAYFQDKDQIQMYNNREEDYL